MPNRKSIKKDIKKTMHQVRIHMILLLLAANVFLVTAQNDTLFNQTDANNLKQGFWKRQYDNGNLMYQGYFRDDRPVGEMKRYYESGALQAFLYYGDDGEYVRARLFYENGSLAAEGLYYLTAKDSIWKYYSYYDQSLALKESYVQGRREGPMWYYYDNGSISEILEWKNDVKHGNWVQYFNDHSIKLKGTFVNGKLEGDFIVYHENGTPHLVGYYLDDRRNGIWTFYHEDGTVEMELEYINGRNTDEDKLDEKQMEFFRMIEENKGKFDEPDETNFLMP